MSDGFPAWARLGVAVVFVGLGDMPIEPGAEGYADPTVGCVYRINWVGKIAHQFCVGVAGLDDRAAWDVRCFRPAVEPKSEADDVAMFRDLIRQPEHA